MLLYGPVRAPEDAMSGAAEMLVELPMTSRYASVPTTLPVVIE